MKERRTLPRQLWLMYEALIQMPHEWKLALSFEKLLEVTSVWLFSVVTGQPNTLRDIVRSTRNLGNFSVSLPNLLVHRMEGTLTCRLQVVHQRIEHRPLCNRHDAD